MPRFVEYNSLVIFDKSGHIKFPLLYLSHVTLLTPGSGPAQARLSLCSG